MPPDAPNINIWVAWPIAPQFMGSVAPPGPNPKDGLRPRRLLGPPTRPAVLWRDGGGVVGRRWHADFARTDARDERIVVAQLIRSASLYPAIIAAT